MAEPVAKHCDLGPMHGAASCYTDSEGVERCDFCGNPADAPAPSPCPSCAAKDAELAAFKQRVSDKLLENYGGKIPPGSFLSEFVIPDPVAEALKAAWASCWPDNPPPLVDKHCAMLAKELASHGFKLSRLPLGGA